jgi:alkaline phosphatase D
MIISSGDIVYHIGPCNNFSSYGIQNSYDTLINLKESKSMWSNYTWVCVNDDHDISFNDGMKDSSNIKLLRKKLDENFPIGEQVMDPNKFRATYFNLKDVYFITLDTVTERTFNIDSQQNGNTYLTILGEDQLNYLRNVLCCIYQLTGSASLIFIVVGKSMFGSSGAFPDECIKEKEQIFEYIRKLKLKNIVFICGDSHFSDFTEYKDKDSGLIIREIRNSAITSEPKNPLTSDNPNRYSGSFSGGVNNFGFVDVNGVTGKYKVTYTNYTLNGEQFKYTWKME